MMDVQIVDPCTSPQWLRFVNQHRRASVFHHPAWLSMLRDVYGYEPFAVCAADGTSIKAGIPFAGVKSPLTGRRWISVPFSDYCEPLLAADDSAGTDTLIQALLEKKNAGTPRIEIRWGIDSRLPIHHMANFVYHDLQLHPDPVAVFDTFDKSQTYGIRRSVREGSEVRECKTYEEFEAFYRLQVETRKRLGVPAQPKSFFKGVWEFVLQPGYGFALLVFAQRLPIAGGVFFKFGEKVWYKYGASLYEHRRYHPSHAYIWKAIERACNEGYKVFDFGRTDLTNRTLRDFKNGWGTSEHKLEYSIISDVPPNLNESRLMTIAGKVIRNSPKFVCRISGELLYKHFA